MTEGDEQADVADVLADDIRLHVANPSGETEDSIMLVPPYLE